MLMRGLSNLNPLARFARWGACGRSLPCDDLVSMSDGANSGFQDWVGFVFESLDLHFCVVDVICMGVFGFEFIFFIGSGITALTQCACAGGNWMML